MRLEHVVRRVDWSAEGVAITTDRGDFTADRVVVTVPIGVLKSADFVIEPPLPEPVAGAVQRLEMNAFEKVFLRFPRRFWDEGVYAIRQQGPHGAWWHSWYDLTAAARGADAAHLRGRSLRPGDPHLGRRPGGRLGAHRPTAALRGRGREPDRVHVTRWQDDPYARGSYAYMTVGSTPEDHDLLATPVGGVLHLSGEATWTEDPATVTAALMSGHRAACTILDRAVRIDELWADTAMKQRAGWWR